MNKMNKMNKNRLNKNGYFRIKTGSKKDDIL